MSDINNPGQMQPPWVAFPEMDSNNYLQWIKQGATEAWFDQIWKPYWITLSPLERNDYYDFWRAPNEWREANDFLFENANQIDMDQDADESERFLAEWRAKNTPKPSWLKKLFGLG